MKFNTLIILLLSLIHCDVFANTAPTAPVVTLSSSSVYSGQQVTVKWQSGTGHIAGNSDFGVYLASPGKTMRLIHGPVSWSAGTSQYQMTMKPVDGVGSYIFRVYACNYSEKCSHNDVNLSVTAPPAPSAPTVSLSSPSIYPGQSVIVKWGAGTGHIAGNSGFGVYLASPGKAMRLIHGPVDWSAGTSQYQTTITPADGVGAYTVRVYACNFSNYCSSRDIGFTVNAPSAPAAPTIVSTPSSVTLGQSFQLKWSAGSGHIAGASDFAVHLTAPGKNRRLIHGPVSWSAATSSYSATFITNEGAGAYIYQVSACNFSNYCTHTLHTVTTESTKHRVTASAGPGGSISPASVEVNTGATTTFTVTPNAGYTAVASGCGGSLSGNTFTTGPVTSACTVNVSFNAQSHRVSVTAGANGSVSPAYRDVLQGQSASFSVTPNAGYTAAASGCGGSLSGNTYTTGAVTSACTVNVSFNAQSHRVSVTAGANGSVSPGYRDVLQGQSTSFSVTPNAGYTAAASGCGGSLSGNTFTTGAVTSACTVTVNFVAAAGVVTPQFSPNGGSYTGSVSVSLSSATAGATIRYSTNGADITASSALYTTPITLTSSATVKARAFKAGMTDSPQQAVSFTVQGNSQQVIFLHTDILGSVVMETDANGNVKKRTEYKPFGESKDN
jgi:hypothetical protein